MLNQVLYYDKCDSEHWHNVLIDSTVWRLFQEKDQVKPNYNSVDLAEVELADNIDGVSTEYMFTVSRAYNIEGDGTNHIIYVYL